MCMTSAVSDYYLRKDRWPVNPFDVEPTYPLHPPVMPPVIADQETRDLMRQVLKLLDKIDKKLGDVECMDEKKAAFLRSLDIDPANIGG